MSQNKNHKASNQGPVLDFISGKTETESAKRLTAGIHNLRSLWLLAKMTGNLRGVTPAQDLQAVTHFPDLTL